MKQLLTLIAVMSLAITACNSSKSTEHSGPAAQNFSLDTATLRSGQEFYQCEMHPEVISDQPGNCPKCGMELAKMNKK